MPRIDPACRPTEILGAAALVTAAMGGASIAALTAAVESNDSDPIARVFDTAIVNLLSGRRDRFQTLQDLALSATKLFRIRRDGAAPAAMKLLALMVPGDLMANTPLDFIIQNLDARLDLLFLAPGQPLPAMVPDHDLMFFAASEPDPATLDRMRAMFAGWRRPVLNDPGLLPLLARERFSALLAGVPGILAPATTLVGRANLTDPSYPALIRPRGSHAGLGLARLEGPADLAAYRAAATAESFYLSRFVDYRGADGMYRKYRVALIDGAARLCHMAVSEHWMVHYLNAGMTESAEKRADEARAMAAFDRDFGARHRDAFARLHALLPFDYFTLDCAELADGRLLVFEADTAALIHGMDPADMFAYKHTQMRIVYDAFKRLLLCRKE
jgi:hypothetical protein